MLLGVGLGAQAGAYLGLLIGNSHEENFRMSSVKTKAEILHEMMAVQRQLDVGTRRLVVLYENWLDAGGGAQYELGGGISMIEDGVAELNHALSFAQDLDSGDLDG